jgi:hypothetical protein
MIEAAPHVFTSFIFYSRPLSLFLFSIILYFSSKLIHNFRFSKSQTEFFPNTTNLMQEYFPQRKKVYVRTFRQYFFWSLLFTCPIDIFFHFQTFSVFSFYFFNILSSILGSISSSFLLNF